MRLLLDENMPESLRLALRQLGHEVNSVSSLRLKGLDNGRLYQEVARGYDICFTKDRRFAEAVRAIDRPGSVKVIHVTLPQTPAGVFTRVFIAAFQETDWRVFANGSDWPARG